MQIDWRTPKVLFNALNEEFGFSLDVCALAWNAQCERFFSPEEDGLKQTWDGVCWCNPPFDATQGKWVKKAFDEAQHGVTTVVILPGNYHDSAWWHEFALRASELRYMRGRAEFENIQAKKTAMRTVILVFKPFCTGPPIIKSVWAKNGRVRETSYAMFT